MADTHPFLLFTPEIKLDIDQLPSNIKVKGQSPRLKYPFALVDIYPTIPVLDPLTAYREIKKQFEEVDSLLALKLKLRNGLFLPPANNVEEALQFQNMIFNTQVQNVREINLPKSTDNPQNVNGDLFQLHDLLPFPFSRASPQKLIHTLAWIDTNIKVTIESLSERYHLPNNAIRQIVQSSLMIYCYLVKQKDFLLARTINFNYSMFIQVRIMNLLLGDTIYSGYNYLLEQGKLANHIALQLLKSFHNLTYRQLLTLSVFMGVVWTSHKDIQTAFRINPDSALSQIELDLKTVQSSAWGVDNIENFLQAIGSTTQNLKVAVVLDDNGESVFDIALFQSFLNDNPMIQVEFMVNRAPISNNIALETFQNLIQDSYFKDLRQHFRQGSAKLCIENQAFRSFEPTRLHPDSRQMLSESNFAYIKGANFFETFQIPDIIRYHCFTVSGPTSQMLTGCSEGKGICVRLEQGQTGYSYHSFEYIETLLQKIAVKEDNNNAW